MRGVLARASRRDLRRALGDEAVQALPAHASRLNLHERSLNSVQLNLDRALIEIHKLQEASATDHGDIEVLRAVQGRNLRGRVRWLVTGR